MTRPPGDSWTPPQTTPAPAAPVDAWGRPALNQDPAADRTALARASARLNTWLTVLLLVLVVGALASALAIFLGGRAGLGSLRTLDPAVSLPAYADVVLGLAALLTLAWAGLYLGPVNWARELLRRLAVWALHDPATPAPDAVRTEQLRRTLVGWLTFGQWGTVATAVFSVALVPISLAIIQRLTEQYAPGSNSDLGTFGPAYQTFQILSSLVSAVPSAVIVWLILGSIRRFMNLSVARARGLATAPVTPAAKLVGNWFMLCLVLLGLGLLNLVVTGILVAVFGSLALSQFSPLSTSMPFLPGLLARVIPLLVGVVVFSVLVYGLYFALLLFSRTYALALGRLLDAGSTPPTFAATPPTTLPTGSAGDNPNVYKGYR